MNLAEVAEKYWTPDPSLVAYLPRVTCRDCSDKRQTCTKHSKKKCDQCGAFISTAHIHLDYVGHPDVNRTLTEIDPEWSWEPAAFDADGLPAIRVHEGSAVLWGRLTLLGKPVWCVGSCENFKSDREKELIGDLIRNGAMRHNVYASLWSKVERAVPVEEPDTKLATKEQMQQFKACCEAAEMDKEDRSAFVGKPWNQVTFDEAAVLIGRLVESDGLVLAKSQAGGWMAYKKDEEPFALDEPAATT